MKINGWELGNGRATFRGLGNVVASVSWVDNVPGIMDSIRDSGMADRGQLSERAYDGGLFRPGLYLRMIVEGNPTGIIMLPTECGERLEEFARSNPAEEFLQAILTMERQCRAITRPMEPEELAAWLNRAEGKNCPGRERFLAALREVDRMVRENPASAQLAPFCRSTPGERDCSSMISWRLGLEFEIQAASLLAYSAVLGPEQNGLAHFLSDSVWTGDTELTMSVMVRRPMAGGDGRGYAVGMIARDPDWMGMFPILEQARDLEATLLPSRALPGTPGVVMLMEDSTGDGIPLEGPDAAALIELLEAHGIRRYRWQG